MKNEYRWSHPSDWLAEKINGFEAGTEFAKLREFALAMAGTLDGDQIQDLFQSDMDGDGYFLNLNTPIPALVQSQGGEERGDVLFFCSEPCRNAFRPIHPVVMHTYTVRDVDRDFDCCEECGGFLEEASE